MILMCKYYYQQKTRDNFPLENAESENLDICSPKNVGGINYQSTNLIELHLILQIKQKFRLSKCYLAVCMPLQS